MAIFALMKWFVFIMASLILALSCMPCRDNACAEREHETKEATHHKTAHNDADDACSPFCTCNCCGSFTISPLLAAETLTPSLHTEKAAALLSGRIAHISIPVWQPPRIG